jgi:hypothetical protein
VRTREWVSSFERQPTQRAVEISTDGSTLVRWRVTLENRCRVTASKAAEAGSPLTVTIKARATEGFSSEALVVSPVAHHGRRREPGPNCIWKINAQRVPPPRSTGLAPTPLPLLAAFFQGKCWSGINHQISYRASDETEPATTPTARHGPGTKTAPSAERADGRLHRSAPQPR